MASNSSCCNEDSPFIRALYEYISHYNRADIEAVMSFVDPNCQVILHQDPQYIITAKNAQEMQFHYEIVWTTEPDFHTTVYVAPQLEEHPPREQQQQPLQQQQHQRRSSYDDIIRNNNNNNAINIRSPRDGGGLSGSPVRSPLFALAEEPKTKAVAPMPVGITSPEAETTRVRIVWLQAKRLYDVTYVFRNANRKMLQQIIHSINPL